MVKTRFSRRIVIDASVAGSAGGREDAPPHSRYCRDFLLAIRQICHRVFMTRSVLGEWKRNESAFSRTWLVSMVAKRKRVLEDDSPREDLRAAVSSETGNQSAAAAMLKDMHLREAALKADGIVASVDKKARRLFGGAAVGLGELRKISWIDPTKSPEEVIAWLAKGADPEGYRVLGPTVA